MAALITVTGTEALTRRLLEIGQDAPKAATRAVNRTLSTVKTATVRGLVAAVGLRNKDVTPAIAIKRATFSNQIGTLTVTGKRIPLIAFGARQTKAGVTYRLPSGRGLIPSGFLATMKSGHRGVFARRGKPRLPIVEQFGPSLPHAMVAGGLLAKMQALGDATLEKNMLHEIDWVTQQRVQAGDE